MAARLSGFESDEYPNRLGGDRHDPPEANFTAPTGAVHWEVLLRARAIESQVFVLAPAQEGRHNPRYRSHGHTMAVDPWGRVLAERAAGVGLVWADIDLGVLHDVRAKLPMG